MRVSPVPIPIPADRLRPRDAAQSRIDIPRPLTSLVGGAATLDGIETRLRGDGVRLLTLTGPGGIGKSRLAVAAAERLHDRFSRIAFVRLAAVAVADEVYGAIARSLGAQVRGAQGVDEAVATLLRREPTLLVLDNLEQIAGIADPVASLLASCPDLAILATSRVTLRLSGEHVLAIPALTIPEEGATLPDVIGAAEAVRLLVERVQDFRPDFALTDTNAAAIAGIARRLEGHPLSIELAAVRLRIMTPPMLLDRLGASLDLLTGGGRDLQPHQRTIRQTIAWSYELLSPEEQRAFRAFSVFPGTFEPTGAAHVLGLADSADLATGIEALPLAVFDLTLALVENSLVRRVDEPDGEMRFAILATIRAFGLEQLEARGEATEARDRHAAWVQAWVEDATERFADRDQAGWIARIEEVYADAQAALAWLGASGQATRLVALAVACKQFWIIRGFVAEGRVWLERAIAAANDEVSFPLRASALHGAGWMALSLGDLTAATAFATRSETLARESGDRHGLVRAIGLHGLIVHRQTHYPEALRLLEEALGLARQAGYDGAIAWALHSMATTTMDLGRYEDARQLFTEAQAAYAAIGNAHGAAQSADNLSVALYTLGEFEPARELAAAALAVFREVGDTRRIAVALDHVGKCARRLGDLAAARRCHQESLPYRQAYGDPRGLAVWLEAVAPLLPPADAATVLGFVASWRVVIHAPLHGNELVELERIEGEVRAALGADGYADRFAAGGGLDLDAAIALCVRHLAHPEEGAVDPFGLSAREREVLLLVVTRARDREIAEVLGIAPRTVARHLASIYRKLGVSSRREAARVASEAGIVPPA